MSKETNKEIISSSTIDELDSLIENNDKPIPVNVINSKRHNNNNNNNNLPDLNESSSFDWGSLNDSELVLATKDTPFPQTAKTDDNNLPPSFNWSSLSDNQLISTINKLSQIYKNQNDYSSNNEVLDDDCTPIPLAQETKNDDNGIPSAQEIKNDDDDDQVETTWGDNYGDELNENESNDLTTGTELQFGDIGKYMENKKINQQNLDKEYVEFVYKTNPNKKYSKIFANCIIYVNGKTNPDISVLHKLIILNGGIFIHYLKSKKSVTHIIAENLTPRKKIEFKNYKVVKPSWILKSIENGKLENWFDHMLINVDYGQIKLDFKQKEQQDVDLNNDNDVELDKDFENSQHDEVIENSTIDAKHPDFLKFFFAKSRLHHLSSWKSELRLNFLKMALDNLKNQQQQQQRKTVKSPIDKRVIIHVDFDCFFVAVSARFNNPPYDINKSALCVTHGGPNSDVSSCNYLARSKGVTNGSWLKKAKKLCPDLICLDYNFNKYEEISNLFYKFLLNMKIDSILPVSVDEALLDVTSLIENGDFENELEIMSYIKSKIWELTNCSVSLGCGSNVLLAKLSLRKAKPNGIFSVLNYSNIEIMNFLSDLNFKHLPGIGSAIYYKLIKELNLLDDDNSTITLSMVQKIKKDKLMQLFGSKTGSTIYDQVRGIDLTSIDILSNPDELTRKSISVDVNWGIRFDNKRQVEEFLSRLAIEINQRMTNLKINSKQMTLKLAKRNPKAPITPPKFMGMGVCDFISKSSRLGLPTRDTGVLMSELKSLWRQFGFPASELRGISVTMSRLIDDSKLIENDANQMKLNFTKLNNNNSNNKEIKIDYSRFQKNETTSTNSNSDKKIDVVNLLKTSTTTTTTKTKTKIEEQLNVDDIDWAIFNELPPSIQQELKRELETREKINYIKRSSSPLKKSPVKTNNNNTKNHEQLLSNQPILNFEKSPNKKRKLLISSPSKELSPIKLNNNNNSNSNNTSPLKKRQNVEFDQIGSEIEVTKKWCHLTKFNSVPIFQKCYDSKLLNNRLNQWLKFSIENKGPHELDLDLFEDYLVKLISVNEFGKVVNILHLLKNWFVYYRKNLSNNDNDNDNDNHNETVKEGLKCWEKIIDELFGRFVKDKQIKYDELLMSF